MNRTLDHIKHLESYFADIHSYIHTMPQPQDRADIERKTLYAAYIDALSRFIFPNLKSNKERYIAFLDRILTWENGSRVSTPLLFRLLKRCPEPEFNELRVLISEKISSWKPGHVVPVTADLDFSEVVRKWPSKNETLKVVGEIRLIDLKQSTLLYRYRNSLIHEFHPLSTDFDAIEAKEPCYVYISGRESYWILVYSRHFLEKLTSKALSSTVQYLKDHNIDPYDSLSDTTHWFEELQ